MKTTDFDYELPDELIAHYPIDSRSSSRLLVRLNEIEHRTFQDITNYFDEGDLLIINNTSVIPARIYGKKESGGSIELMLERELVDNKALVQIRSGNPLKAGTKMFFDQYEAKCIDRKDNFFVVKFVESPSVIFNDIGHVPLPPYIKRHDEEIDKKRYATVYENKDFQNSVAAPTAGLHFDNELLQKIKNIGVETLSINLSVGAGTFQPVKTENIKDHKIHKEFVEVSDEIVDKVKQAKSNGKKIFAVGTTTLRAIETAFIEEKGYKGSYKDFLNRTKADELDSRIRFFNSGGSVKPNGKAKDKPFTTAIERKYGILLSGNETLAEVLEMIKNKPQE